MRHGRERTDPEYPVLLGITPSRRNFDKYMRLAGLESELREALYSQKVSLEQALLLSEAAADSRLEILRRALLIIKLNNNETREVLKELQEVASRDEKSIGEVIDQLESRSERRELKGSFRRELRMMRYPALTLAEEEFSKCLKDISLPKEVNVFYPPFLRETTCFEGNYMEIRMRVESSEKLSEIISSLASAIKQGKMDTLLNIIKEGSTPSD